MATTVMPVHDGLPELHPIRFDRSESAAIKDHLNEHGVSPAALFIHATAACRQLATFLQQSSLSQVVRVRNFSTQ